MRIYPFGKVQKKLLACLKSQHKKEQDKVFLVSGRVGSGKSHFSLDCLDYLWSVTNHKPDIRMVARNLSEYVETLKVCPWSGFCMLDEGEELSSDRSQEKASKKTREIFTIIRGKAMITFILHPNPLKVNTYFREDRIEGVFFVKRRGVVYYYTNRSIKKLLTLSKKLNYKGNSFFANRNYVEPAWSARFPEYKGDLLGEYVRRKNENIDESLKLLSDKLNTDKKDIKIERTFSMREAAKLLKCQNVRLQNFLESGVIQPRRNATGRKYMLSYDDLLVAQDWLNKHQKNPWNHEKQNSQPLPP